MPSSEDMFRNAVPKKEHGVGSLCKNRSAASEINLTNTLNILPELLSPAGSPAAMLAAINAGADAVYFGMPDFNARINADNFTFESLGEYLRLCHLMGVKAYVTLNTQIYKREKEAFLKTARLAYEAGADAAIVGDLGAAALLKEHLPQFPLHASTQLSGHNSASGAELSRLGFSRMVCAREMPLSDIKTFAEESPIEAEIFIHGALCVCHSGQCLFSSLVGGRSGNRGLCAQPCRLPYKVCGRTSSLGTTEGAAVSGNAYPLSLKDVCLAKHIPEIIDSGVSSLKIEGRMKPADYVGRVTEVYRRLLDERRAATDEEVAYLADVFSRGGSFTDRYFTSRISSDMLGVRTDGDKESSKRSSACGVAPDKKTIPVNMSAVIKRNTPMTLSLSLAEIPQGRYPRLESASVTVTGEPPLDAISKPTDRALAEKNLGKLGATNFSLSRLDIEIDEGIMVPVSALNSLRRSAVASLEELLLSGVAAEEPRERDADLERHLLSGAAADTEKRPPLRRVRAAIFTEVDQIPRSAEDYFDEIYLPATEFSRMKGRIPPCVNGVALPPVIFDSERASVRELLSLAADEGVRYALVENIGHARLAEDLGFELIGGFRLNVSNAETANTLGALGFGQVTLSPELSLPRVRGIAAESPVGTRAIVYGKIPLMVVEKCVICEGIKVGSSRLCPLKDRGDSSVCRSRIIDRTGAEFPVIRELGHRNVIFNSLPVYMGDKLSDVGASRLRGEVYIFSDESRDEVSEVIAAYSSHRAPVGKHRRMGVKDL